MKFAAGSPGGSNGADDPRSDRPPESASFATAPVGGRRGRQPIFILGFVAVLAGMVAVGVGGRTTIEPAPVPPVAIASPSPSPILPTATPRATPRATPGHAPIFTTGPGAIQLLGRRHPETLFVHGDVYVDRVTWVFVSLRNDEGLVTGWASVSVPGAAGPNASTGPTLRFDVELPLPETGFDGTIWVYANGYDADGVMITTAILEIAPADPNPVA